MAFRDSTVNETFGGPPESANLVGLRPSGTTDRDVLLAMVVQNNSAATFTAPNGWTVVEDASHAAPDGQKVVIYKKIADSEPTQWTWVSNNNSANATIIVAAWSGRIPGGTLISAQTTNTSSNTTPVSVAATGVTALVEDDVAYFSSLDSTASSTWSYSNPSSFTLRENDSNANDIHVTLSTLDNTVAGATGTITSTATRTAGTGNGGWSAVVVSIPKFNIPVAWFRA